MKLKLHWQILIAIALAVAAGLLSGPEGSIFGLKFFDVYSFVGKLFLNGLKMIIVPLIAASIMTGVASLGGDDSLGRLGAKTLLFYTFSSLVAILVGLLMVNIFTPGIVDGQPAGALLSLTQGDAVTAVVAKVQNRGAGDIAGVFLRMVPANIFQAAHDGEMLGLIFFCLLFGYFMTRIKQEYRTNMNLFWQGVYETMMHITDWIMKFAPIGVFGLVAKTVSTTGMGGIVPLLWFFGTVIGALALHAFGTLPLLLLLLGRVSPARHFRAMAPALLTAFSTASSSATLPLTLDCVEKNAGVSNKTSSFVLPLGATVNMDGTALYECTAAMFIAQAYGLELNFTQQFLIVFTALVTSIGVAGIPQASLVAISVILKAIGLPLEAIGILLVTDRVLDMCRTSVNVFSDSCAAVIIARSEGEDDVLRPAS